MTPVNDPGLYARSFADVYDAWYGDLDDPAHVVAALVARCRAGARVVEFGGGTGRLAGPIADAGFGVISLDASVAMLAASPPGVLCIVSDMAAPALRPGCADVIVVAYNTLFNLASIELQQRCLTDASVLLADDGMLAIEGFIAPTVHGDTSPSIGTSSRPHPTDPEATLTIITEYLHQPGGAFITGMHVEQAGTTTGCRPWQLMYQSPAQLDAAAMAGGLALIDRRRDWEGNDFEPDGDQHVSWYRRRDG